MDEYGYEDYDENHEWYDEEEDEPACDICGCIYDDHDEIMHLRFDAISAEVHYFLADHPCLECGEQWRMVRLHSPDETVTCEQAALNCDYCSFSGIMLLNEDYQAIVIYRGISWMFSASRREEENTDTDPDLPF